MSFTGDIVGHSVSSSSPRGEDVIGEAVSDIKLDVKEVELTVSTPDDTDGGGVVKGDDLAMQSSLLT